MKSELHRWNKVAYAQGTWKNLGVQWESYLLFCIHFELVSLPAATKNLHLFAQISSRTIKFTDSIKNYINGEKSMHLLVGYLTDKINK